MEGVSEVDSFDYLFCNLFQREAYTYTDVLDAFDYRHPLSRHLLVYFDNLHMLFQHRYIHGSAPLIQLHFTTRSYHTAANQKLIIYTDFIYLNQQPKMASNVSQNAQQATGSSNPAEQQQQNADNKQQTWGEYGKQVYNEQYERWMPWIEDFYLRWFTKDNKASYATKDTLSKTKITGNKQVDNLQDGVHNLVAGQVGQDGLLQPVGDAFSKEGINRAERGGKDDQGSYAPGPAGAVVNPIAQGGKTVGNGVVEGGKSVGGMVGGLFGGGKKAEQK